MTLGAFRGRFIDLRGEYEPNDGSLTEQAVVDGIAQQSHAVNIGGGLAVFDSTSYVFDTAKFPGAGRKQFYLPRALSADGRTYVQRLTFTGQNKFRLFSYHVGMVPESRSRAFNE